MIDAVTTSNMRVSEARERYFASNGFSESDYRDRWINIKVGPIPLWFPNIESRQRAIPIHDLHHVATGYATTWTGEAEISAWEIGGGCNDYWAAWLINLTGLGIGLALAPRRIYRSFVRGRRSRNLYQEGWSDQLLGISVGELRERMQLDADESPPSHGERAAFIGWTSMVAAAALVPLAVTAIGAALLL